MKILFVEPEYRRLSARLRKIAEGSSGNNSNDETLWYPPLSFMKLARFHKSKGDEVVFVRGCDKSLLEQEGSFHSLELWDRVYITTLFTFHYDKIIKTINFYKQAVGGTLDKIFVGGIAASLMPKQIYEETGVYPVTGILNSPKQIGLKGTTNIDLLPPDYELLDNNLYAINDTFYAYTTRGCVNTCKWCGVNELEPSYVQYIDIKPIINELRNEYGDMSKLKLMDNNVLASPKLGKIVEDLVDLGYGRNQFTDTNPKKKRVVDFNQGLDASYFTEESMKLLAKLNIKPMRIAFDRITERRVYLKAIELAYEHGVTEFSNYMLYNFKDTPKDLYERLVINMSLNRKWANGTRRASVYSYPMRFAPIGEISGNGENRSRDYVRANSLKSRDWLENPIWTKRFVRSIEIMKGAAHGAISPTPELAQRTIGKDFQEFVTNLYMPEELLRNRSKHEKRIYDHEPKRRPGTGKIEEFRKFLLGLVKTQDESFVFFHEGVSANSSEVIRQSISACKDTEMKKWLKLYLKR